MKVLFPPVENSHGGKGHFLWKLAEILPSYGVDVVYEGDHDLQLGNIRYHCKSSKPRILRLDGVIHNTAKPWREKNAAMRDCVDKSDGVICQSVFGYEMVSRFVGFGNAKTIIINNGADGSAKYILPELSAKFNFLAVSKWRPHKRLKDTIESYLLADIPDSKLWVIGSITDDTCDFEKYFKKNKNIEYVGHVDDRNVLYGYMKAATVSVHLCWFDCFPNSVVEAVCMGCPVITNNVGGTHEIVRPSGGIVLNIDKEYDYRPTDLYHPPAIDRYKVAEAMQACATKRPEITHDHVDITTIAKQYKAFFERFV